MSTIRSFDEPVSLLPTDPSRAVRRFGARLRVYWSAFVEGLAAARLYTEMTGRGEPHETAVQVVFERHFHR